MPLKLNIGLSRKIGEANYGSRGASVNLEVEVDSGLVTEPGKFHERVRQLFGLVRTSLTEELNGANGNGHTAAPATGTQGTRRQPAPATSGNGNTKSAATRTNGPRPATQSQIRAILTIANRQHLNLADFLQQRFRTERPEDLSIKQASEVIDELKSS
jgi:hypothetical protein